MKRVLAAALLALATAVLPARADEPASFWDLPPKDLAVLVASPQVMVTRTAAGLSAYCRCPVVLRPREIPDAMK